MSTMPLAITSSRIISSEGERSGHLIIEGSKIVEVLPFGKLPDHLLNYNVGDQVVMPGLIDSHVHINEPGRTSWEGFETATKSAVSGGITTLIDMPLNSSPVTVNSAAFQEKLEASNGKLFANCGFWGGYVPGSLDGLVELLESGVMGIKVFMIDSGLDEFQAVTKKDLHEAMALLKDADMPLLAHAEVERPLPYPNPLERNPSSYQAHLKSRPDDWEYAAIEILIDLCQEFKTKVHVVHLSSASALPLLSKARRQLPITVETCPHYLYFSSEEIPDQHPEFKCTPPIRDKQNRELLWQALTDRTIDFVATDHSPSTPDLKCVSEGNLEKAWGGISSLQFLLPVVWTCGQSRGQSIQFVSKILSENCARFLGLENRKGKIARGYDADLVIWNPEQEFVVQTEDIRFRHPLTPYLGHKLKGVVNMTFVNGHLVFDNNEIDPEPRGTVLLRNSHKNSVYE